MTEIVVAIMEWQTPALCLVMICALIILRIAKASSKWCQIAFWSIIFPFVLLVCAEAIYLSRV